jgi:hypothetical protein
MELDLYWKMGQGSVCTFEIDFLVKICSELRYTSYLFVFLSWKSRTLDDLHSCACMAMKTNSRTLK